MRRELEQLRETFFETIQENKIDMERRLTSLEQYSHRECVELVGLPADLKDDLLEDAVVDAFAVAGVRVQKRDFHAIHRLGHGPAVIAKLVNRRDALAVLKNKKTSDY